MWNRGEIFKDTWLVWFMSIRFSSSATRSVYITINFKKKIGLNVAERIEKATSGVVKATKEDWPNLSDVPKRVYYN